MLEEEKSSARRRTNTIDCVAFFFEKQRRIKMYQVKDAVLYGMQGVCEIEAIEEKEFFGEKRMYYVMRQVYQNASTIYIPVDNEKSISKMRKVLSAEEIKPLILGMPEEKTKWIVNDAVRKEKFKEVLQGGKREELIVLIKSVYLHKQKLLEEGKKKLHVADENAMKDAERLLYDEFAYVLKLERNEVLPFILEQIDVK